MPKYTISEVLEKASQALKDEEFENCSKFLDALGDERALQLPPHQSAKYHELRGDVAMQEGDFETAASAYEATLVSEKLAGESKVGLAFSNGRLAKSLIGCEKFDQAHSAFGEAVRLLEEGEASGDDRTSIWFEYGHALWEADRHKPAISALEEALRLSIESGQDPKGIAGVAFFLSSSWRSVVELESLAKSASAIFAESAAAGVPSPEGVDEINEAGKSLTESLMKAESISASAIDWLKKADEKDYLFVRAYKDYSVILSIAKKHSESAQALRSAIARAKEDDFSDEFLAGLKESLNKELAAADGSDSQAESDDENSVEEEDASAPMVRFPFDLSNLEIDSSIYELLDINFDPSSFDYLEQYQLETGTWWVCAFARNGIRDLIGFRLMPGQTFKESPILSVAENSTEVKTVCRSIADFIPTLILECLYSNWDEFTELSDSPWDQMIQLHTTLGGTGKLESFRNFIKNPENRERLIDSKLDLLGDIDSEQASLPEPDYEEDAEDPKQKSVISIGALTAHSPWRTRLAAWKMASAASAGRDPDSELIESAWILFSAPAALDMEGTALTPTQILNGASILVRTLTDERANDPIILAASSLANSPDDYDGVAHFHSAIGLIKKREYARAFNAFVTLAYFSWLKAESSAPPALDAALALAEQAGWEDARSSLIYLKSLRDTDGWADDVVNACVTLATRVKEAYIESLK